MISDYNIVSPSLDGILRHESLEYEGVRQSEKIKTIFDRPSGYKSVESDGLEDHMVVAEYFHDLYGVLMKKFSLYAVDPNPGSEDDIKLLAMFQEFIKVKRYLIKNSALKSG